MDPLPSDDPLATCPFDPDHRIDPARLSFHLVRCRKSILDNRPPGHPLHKWVKSLVSCGFNSAHWVPKKDLDAHHLECSSRIEMELDLDALTLEPVRATRKKKGKPVQTGSENEDGWDEMNCGTYDPLKKILESDGKIMLSNMSSFSRIQRRDFQARVEARCEERERSEVKVIPGLGSASAATPLTASQKKKLKKRASKEKKQSAVLAN